MTSRKNKLYKKGSQLLVTATALSTVLITGTQVGKADTTDNNSTPTVKKETDQNTEQPTSAVLKPASVATVASQQSQATSATPTKPDTDQKETGNTGNSSASATSAIANSATATTITAAKSATSETPASSAPAVAQQTKAVSPTKNTVSVTPQNTTSIHQEKTKEPVAKVTDSSLNSSKTVSDQSKTTTDDKTNVNNQVHVMTQSTVVTPQSAFRIAPTAPDEPETLTDDPVDMTGNTMTDQTGGDSRFLDPNPQHYTFAATNVSDGSTIVSSTDRNGDGTVFLSEFAKDGTPLGGYTLNTGQTVTSTHFGFIYRNGQGMLSLENVRDSIHASLLMNDNTRSDRYYWIPQRSTISVHFVDENNQTIKATLGLQGMANQVWNSTPQKITGYTLDQTKLPKDQTGTIEPYQKGWESSVDLSDGLNIKYQQIDDAGTVTATITDQHLFDKDPKPTTQVYTLPVGTSSSATYKTTDYAGWASATSMINPVYLTQRSVTYVYSPIYTITSNKVVHETINYVDSANKVVAPKTMAQITYMVVHDATTNADTTYYSTTANKGTIDQATGLPSGNSEKDNTWTSTNGYYHPASEWKTGTTVAFNAVANPTVPGLHVVSNDAPQSDLTTVSAQSTTIDSKDSTFKVVYAPNYVITNSKIIQETISYVDDTGLTVSPKVTTKLNFVLVHDAVKNTDTGYYSASATAAVLDPVTGIPTGDWHAGATQFSAVNNPQIVGYRVIRNNAPDSSLTAVSAQPVTVNSTNKNYTVVYADIETVPTTPEKPDKPAVTPTIVPTQPNKPNVVTPTVSVTPTQPETPAITPIVSVTPTQPAAPVVTPLTGTDEQPDVITPANPAAPKPKLRVKKANKAHKAKTAAKPTVSKRAKVASLPKTTLKKQSSPVVKKSALLPQTNDKQNTNLAVLGLSVLFLTGLFGGTRRKH